MSELTWDDFNKMCNNCTACELSKTRTQAVVWRGAVAAPLLLIGEGPGANEDLEGKPFVGRSGRLLDELLTAHGITPEYFHIMNIVKCRPPQNRKPTEAEAKACRPLLRQQFLFVKPRVILLLGATAYNNFTGDKRSISQVRGRWQESNGYYIMPTFHPAYILRDPRQKDKFWGDLEMVRIKLEEFDLLPSILA